MPPGCGAYLAQHDMRCTVAGDVLAPGVALVMVYMLLSHAKVRTTTPPDGVTSMRSSRRSGRAGAVSVVNALLIGQNTARRGSVQVAAL